MLQKKLTAFITIAIVAPAVFIACQKEITQKERAVKSATAGSDLSTSKPMFTSEEMNEIGLIYSTNPEAAASALPGADVCGAIVTYDPAPDVYPRTVTYDWGTGCTSTTGIARSGKLIYKYTGDLSIIGSKVTVSYDNYYFNGVKIEGKLKWSNNEYTQGENLGQLKYRLTYKDRKTIQTNGDYTIVNGHTRIIRGTDNEGYPGFPMGDFRETSSDSAPLEYTTSIGGVIENFTVDITNTLIYKSGCDWITKGMLLYNYTDLTTATLDYGTGDCDDQAWYTDRDGTQYWITVGP